jgi:hypothetical protein
MTTILQQILLFIIVMTLILWMIPDKKIRTIADFFRIVLPKTHLRNDKK